MPSSNGVYTLPPGYLAATGTPILVSEHNPIFEDVAAALTARLSRDGSAPMTGPINLSAGSVTSPSLIFQGNVGNGIYPTANGIGVSIGGVQTVEFLPGGLVGSRVVGELVPFTGTAAPSSLWLLPFGQTVSRITYDELWAFAQIEIANGNLGYNNGDGSTTFGIPDVRGRVPAGWDSMGGTAASRLTTAGSGVNGAILGTVAGLENETLTRAQIPTGITSANASQSITVHPDGSTSNFVPYIGSLSWQTLTTPNTGGNSIAGSNGGSIASTSSLTGVNSITVTSTNTGGAAHPNVQPTFICNYILFAGT
jgi:microcystin-dependent protein